MCKDGIIKIFCNKVTTSCNPSSDISIDYSELPLVNLIVAIIWRRAE